MTAARTVPAARIARAPVAGDPHDVRRPDDGALVALAGWAGVAEVAAAVDAAVAARTGWGATSGSDRAAALRAIAVRLRAAAPEAADAVAAESGKRLPEAVAEVEFTARYFDWFATAAERGQEETRMDGAGRRFRVRRHPLGVVAAVGTWNFPLSIPARKIAAALAAGCPVVLKASERTPVSADLLVAICESELPSGVIGSVNGDGEVLVGALIAHPEVAGVSYTGSTAVGRRVAEQCARHLTRAVLELGGRAPFVIRHDADVPDAVDHLLVAKLRNNGESCIAANNVLVHASIVDEVVAELERRADGIRPGRTTDEHAQLGPLIDHAAVERLRRLLDDAEADGATVVRGPAGPADGSFHPFAVVRASGHERIWSEEVFGPAVVVRGYHEEDDLVQEVNGWGTGLAGYVCGEDVEAAERLAARFRIGIVGINNGAPNSPEVPFGGFGVSGIGREGGMSGYYEFTEEQTLSTAVA